MVKKKVLGLMYYKPIKFYIMLTLRKINLKEIKNSLKRDEMRKIVGGSGTCPDGRISCTCNGQSFCVTSVQECWDKC